MGSHADLRRIAIRDQDDAAHLEGEAGLRLLRDCGGEVFDGARLIRMPAAPWLARWRDETNRALDKGAGVECVHVSGAGVWLSACWRPGLFICTDSTSPCGRALDADEREDNTCDGCGVYFPHGTKAHISQVSWPGRGTVLVVAGVCAGCLAAVGLADTPTGE